MALTQAQRTLIEKARAAGSSELGTGLDDPACSYLVATIARDLDVVDSFPELPENLPDFFITGDPKTLALPGHDFLALIETLLRRVPDADTYFACLAALQKARLKYARILETQALPTMDQVGPRALLQYGQMDADALAGFLLWRKWLFDIDNRAGQETGYLFEPIIANSIGGASFSAAKSPIRREDDDKGRQVDCIRGLYAYEIKIRVTIAASGQGRWKEELDFPVDCRRSGYTPVLIVLDPTPNPKLEELVAAFGLQGGHTYVGEAAWQHLDEAAGATMSAFLEKYVRGPLTAVLGAAPDSLPDICFGLSDAEFSVRVLARVFSYPRKAE